MMRLLLYAVSLFMLYSCENPHGPMENDDIKNQEDCECAGKEDREDNVVCIIEGNDIYVRARQYSPTEDMVWKLTKVKSFHNKYFNISGMYTCPVTTSEEATVSSLTLWKDSSDDLCPTNMMGTYIGGNHGYDCVDKLKSRNHGKTDSDIGSVWVDSQGKTYVLTHVYDSDNLGFVMFDDTSMATGRMSYGNPVPGTKMTHQSGAADQTAIQIESRSGAQLWQCFNKYFMSVSVDGRKISPSADGVYKGSVLEIETQYNIIFVPAMLNYLMENVGRNDKDSQHSDSIDENYMTVYVSYGFNRNGSVSTYCSYHVNKDISLGYIGLVQSMAISSDTYTYVPDTVYDSPTRHGGTELKLIKDMWRSAGKAPYRYYQFADGKMDKGMCLAYDRSIGMGQNESRLKHLDHAGKYSKAQKIYPCLLSGGTLQKGTFFDAMAVRIPLYRYDEDLMAVAWYWNGNDIILMLDMHKAITREITLPEYMNGMRLEVIDMTPGIEVDQKCILDSKLRMSAPDCGYLVLRLYE